MTRGRVAFVVAMNAALGSACTPMVRGAYLGHEETVLDTRAEERPTGMVRVASAQEGTMLRVDARNECQRVERQRVRRDHRWDREMKEPLIMASLAASGAVGVGLGIYFIAAADALPLDELTASETRSSGIMLAAIGGVLLAVAGVAVVQSWADEEQMEELERDGRVLQADLVCANAAAPGQQVAIVGPDRPIVVGVTGLDGSASFDLAAAIPRQVVLQDNAPATTPLLVGGHPRGSVDLALLRAHHAELTWRAIQPDLCLRDVRAHIAQCRALQRFIEDFPASDHVAEAERVLTTVRERLAEERRRAEEEARLRAEAEARARAEEEARRRAEEEAYARQVEEERRRWEAQLEAERQDAIRREAQATERRRCADACRRTCRGQPRACVEECERETCR